MVKSLRKGSLGLAVIAFILLVAGLLTGTTALWQFSAIGLSVFISLGLGAIPFLAGYQYTAWIITAVVSAMICPSAFLSWGNLDLRNEWLILLVVQLVMFGMGVQMKISDFTNVGSTGRGVLIGLLCQFTIMPVTGFLLTRIFNFEGEIAAGVILIGACSSGLASNVMVYIARANLVLSVTVTAMATLLAPLLTPFMMKLLAGTLVDISFINMMISIIKIVIVPIGAALLHDYLKNAPGKIQRNLITISVICSLWLLALPMGLWKLLEVNLSPPALQSATLFSFMLGAVAWGVAYHYLVRQFPKLDQYMPYISMFGIVYFTTVTTAAGRDNLMQIGLLLFMASVIHNGAGYFLGYWFSRALGLNKNSARSMAFEVGLQNGGMASGLAGMMGKMGTVGLAAAVFSPWMNISGSILANFWKNRPLHEEQEKVKIKSFSKASVE